MAKKSNLVLASPERVHTHNRSMQPHMRGCRWVLEVLECFSKFYTYVGVFEVICYLNVAELSLLFTAAHLKRLSVYEVDVKEWVVVKGHPSSLEKSTRPLPALSLVFLLLQITVIWAWLRSVHVHWLQSPIIRRHSLERRGAGPCIYSPRAAGSATTPRIISITEGPE